LHGVFLVTAGLRESRGIETFRARIEKDT